MSLQELVIDKNIFQLLINESEDPSTQLNCVNFMGNILECCKNVICSNDYIKQDFEIDESESKNSSFKKFYDKWLKEMKKRRKIIEKDIETEIGIDCNIDDLKYYQTAFNTNDRIFVTQNHNFLDVKNEIFNEYGIRTLNIKEANKQVLEFQHNILTEDQILQEFLQIIQKYQNQPFQLSDLKIFLDQIKFFTPNREDNIVIRECMINILKRVKNYFFTFDDITEMINQQIDEILPEKGYNFVVFDETWDKSNNFWTYFMKKTNQSYNRNIQIFKSSEILDRLNIIEINENNKQVLIFIDDIIGSGSSYVRLFLNNFNSDYNKIDQLKRKYIRLYLVAGIGSLESKNFISGNTPIIEDRIRYSKVIRREDRAFYESNWPDSSKLEKFKKFLKILDNDYWNGYGGQEFVVVLEWNTPNNTISCLWKNNIEINSRKWKPLFPRS